MKTEAVYIVRNFLIMLNNSQQIHIKTTSKKSNSKTVEATGDLIGNKIANRITKVSRSLLQNNSETITREYFKEIPEERYISRRRTESMMIVD